MYPACSAGVILCCSSIMAVPDEKVCSKLEQAAKLAGEMATLSPTQHRARLPGGADFQGANLYTLLGFVQTLVERLGVSLLGQKSHVGVDARTPASTCARAVCGTASVLPMATLCETLEEAEYKLQEYVGKVSDDEDPDNGPAVLNEIEDLQRYLGAGGSCWAKLCSADGGRVAFEAPAEPVDPYPETPARMIQRHGGNRRGTRRRVRRKRRGTRSKGRSRTRRRKTRRKK